MTGRELYKLASAFLYESDGDDTDTRAYSVDFLNVLLQECFPVENSIRAYKGAEALTSAPYLLTIDETVPYDDALTRGVIPYGLAAFYYRDNDDFNGFETYRGMYVSGLSDASKYTLEEVEGVYG